MLKLDSAKADACASSDALINATDDERSKLADEAVATYGASEALGAYILQKAQTVISISRSNIFLKLTLSVRTMTFTKNTLKMKADLSLTQRKSSIRVFKLWKMLRIMLMNSIRLIKIPI